MDHITILPEDVDLSEPQRYLRLPHPRTGQPQLYLLTATGVLEVVRLQKGRTWFLPPGTVQTGSILLHIPVDPLFLLVPILLLLAGANANASASASPALAAEPTAPFQPLADLVAAASTNPAFGLAPAFSPEGKREGYNADVARLLAHKPVRRTFRLACERKLVPSAAPPSPPADDATPAATGRGRGTAYYRPSVPRLVHLLRGKVEHMAHPGQWNKFDHLVRAQHRDGLTGPGEAMDELRAQARRKSAMEHMGQWLPKPIMDALESTYDFVQLRDYLANRTAAAAAAAAPVINEKQAGPKAGAKRKAPPASRGVESLKKVNTTSMSKLTSFFKPKEK